MCLKKMVLETDVIPLFLSNVSHRAEPISEIILYYTTYTLYMIYRIPEIDIDCQIIPKRLVVLSIN